MPAFENRDAGAEPRRFQRYREAGEPGPDHTDIDVHIERQPRALAHPCGIGSVDRACGTLAHVVFLRTDQALVTLS